MTLAGKQGGFCPEYFYNELLDCYTDTERAFLCDYFKIKRPGWLKDTDIYQPVAKGIYVKRGQYSDEYEIPNAVARLVLQRIQEYLPAWGGADSEGKFVIARNYTRKEVALVSFQPQHLFTINWADSGPGFSWPEAYYLVWLPVFERYVVTASQDSPDCYGFEDIAIGWQFFDEDRVGLSKEIIQANWGAVHKPHLEEGWAYLFETGVVSQSEAEDWRNDIWPEESPDDEEDDQ